MQPIKKTKTTAQICTWTEAKASLKNVLRLNRSDIGPSGPGLGTGCVLTLVCIITYTKTGIS